MTAETSSGKTAPQPLYVVQEFVNSVDLEEGDEQLGSPEALGEWLAEHGLMAPGEPVSQADLRRALDVREGLRALLLANNDLAPDGVDGAIARLMAIVAVAVEHGDWARLKACPAENCFWAFYDRSKNRSGRWCKMEVCGNVEKARAFRERHRSARV
jgi:CGNR zinc finger protein/putative stress-induced transcription regulator